MSDEFVNINETGASESTPVADENVNQGVEQEATPGSESQPAEQELYTIKVQGKERKVTLDELIKLAQMGDDYTRKTQQLGVLRELGDLLVKLGYDPAEEVKKLKMLLQQQQYEQNDSSLPPEIYEIKSEVEQLKREKVLMEQEQKLADRPYFKEWFEEIKAAANEFGTDYETAYAWKLYEEFPNILKKWEEEKAKLKDEAIKEYLAKKRQPHGVVESGDGATPVLEVKGPKTFEEARKNAIAILKEALKGGS